VSKSAVLLFVLVFLTASCSAVFLRPNVQAALSPFTGEIRIAPDGAVQGTDMITRNDNVYTLVGDMSGSVGNGEIFITIEKDGVIFDGLGKTIRGTGTGIAIAVYGRKDVTIKNTRIIDFGTGIELRSIDFESNSTGSNNQILDNYLESEYWGTSLDTDNGVISGNTIVSKNDKYGVLFRCNNTVFSNNAFVDGGLIRYEPATLNVFSGNTINGKPLVYLEGQASQVVNNAAQVFLVDCKNMIVRNVDTTAHLRVTIELSGTTNTKISNCRGNIVLRKSNSNIIAYNHLTAVGSMVSYSCSAIELSTSNNNTITDNSIEAANSYGVLLTGSSYNHVQRSSISSAGHAAITLESTTQSNSEFNYIHENNVTCTETGILFKTGARNNFVFKNTLTGCKNSIMLSSGYNNTFVGNNISSSTQYAVYLSASDYNIFYHNNFLSNAQQAYENHNVYWWFFQNDTYYSEYNTWDNGEEGNYWDDYSGSDVDGDGIGETPYTVYENFTDQYPLTTPFDIDSVNIELPEWAGGSPDSSPSPSQSPSHQETVPFPTAFVAVAFIASATALAAALLVYFRKQREKDNKT
jgi:parallel beta-helix repeat protein